MRPSRNIRSLLKCPFLRLMSLYQGSTKRMIAMIIPAINPAIAPPARPRLVPDVRPNVPPKKRLPKRIPKKATPPSNGERIQRADMMSSVSRLMRTDSVIVFLPSWDAIGAVKCVESATLGDYIKFRRIDLQDSLLKSRSSSLYALELRRILK